MITPAGKECRYYYADYYRGRERQECRLIGQNPRSDPWRPELCKSCPVPGILRANACPNLVLEGSVHKGFLGLSRRVEVSAVCSKYLVEVENPHIGCGHCHEERPGAELFMLDEGGSFEHGGAMLMQSLEEMPTQTDGGQAHPALASVARGNVAFALDLYRELREGEGNLFFSPHSISTALAMTYAGARGNTASQMAQTLHFGLDQQDLHPAFAALEARLNSVQEAGQVALKVANSLWPQTDYPFLQEYLALVQEHYRVMITPVDYVTDAEVARERINAWVAERTEYRIKDLIPQGILDALTRLVLVNAIYFKGNWAKQFDQASTHDAPFRLTAAEQVLVPMMAQEAEFAYAEWEGLQALELPYAGDGLSMLILLPGEVDGLGELEATLTLEKLERWTRALRKKKTRVFLPKFKLTSQFTLNNTLIAMGMADTFDASKADFSGMDGQKAWLYIAAAIHKAFIEVNEEGTEAAAATAVIMGVRSMPLPPPTFRADHPFLFLIRENSTGSILFLGRMADPSSGVV